VSVTRIGLLTFLRRWPSEAGARPEPCPTDDGDDAASDQGGTRFETTGIESRDT
jgi:hypothetical protein